VKDMVEMAQNFAGDASCFPVYFWGLALVLLLLPQIAQKKLTE
jgi:hypothetical protein